jgi:hypothetical protein
MKCPAIGMCWGGCINGSPVIGDNPSAYCNQKKLIDKIAEYANDNTITSLSMCKIKKAE